VTRYRKVGAKTLFSEQVCKALSQKATLNIVILILNAYLIQWATCDRSKALWL